LISFQIRSFIYANHNSRFDVLDVESSLGVGVHVLDLSRDSDSTTLLGLGEFDHSLDRGVSLENSDSLLVEEISDRAIIFGLWEM